VEKYAGQDTFPKITVNVAYFTPHVCCQMTSLGLIETFWILEIQKRSWSSAVKSIVLGSSTRRNSRHVFRVLKKTSLRRPLRLNSNGRYNYRFQCPDTLKIHRSVCRFIQTSTLQLTKRVYSHVCMYTSINICAFLLSKPIWPDNNQHTCEFDGVEIIYTFVYGYIHC